MVLLYRFVQKEKKKRSSVEVSGVVRQTSGFRFIWFFVTDADTSPKKEEKRLKSNSYAYERW